ncbi:hypothetical protein CWI38_0344p0010 [Hamiltosporidium tvaerminnensis]|uniref:Uncharacterized protein n=1 Tax=Hamiltosporidium tvaerminnensis TaxID=1176355 RepID=A0A4Q9LZB5_9MICR|nr:hypothetical protein CWI38_0344p0010 [Hamiltosporidium tvaerminnensis]
MAQSFVIIPIFKKNNNFLTEAKQFHLIEEVIFIKNKNRDPKAIGDCKSEAYPRTFEEHYLPNHIRMTEMFSSIAMICMGFRDGFNPRIVAEADKTEIVNNENDGNSDGKFLLQTDFFDKTCCPSNELLYIIKTKSDTDVHYNKKEALIQTKIPKRCNMELSSEDVVWISLSEILNNTYAEIRVETRIKTYVKIWWNRPDIFILDMRKNKMTVIEVVITYQDSLQTVESKKIRKYDLLANELCLIYKFGAEIIHYVMTWDDISRPNAEERVSVTVILRAEMHKQPSLSLKQVYNQEDGVKTENTKNILSLILDGITSAEVPKINANEHSELEEEIEVV